MPVEKSSAPHAWASAPMAAIIENALDAVITIDSAGIITSWNNMAQKIFGWSRQEAVGRSLAATIIPVQYREAHERGLRNYLATGEGPVLNKRIEITALRRGGQEFPVELAITPLQIDDTMMFSAFVRDITERQQASEALQESEARARAVLDTAAEGIITIDEAGLIETFNPAAARIFGYARDEVIGKNVSMLMPEPHAGQHDGYIANFLRTGQAKIIGTGREVEGQRKDGAIFSMYLAVSEVDLGDRRIFTGIVRDITELKQAQQSLQILNEQLEQRVLERTTQLRREVAERERYEERYRTLFEEAPAMYVITENRNGRPYIKDCNLLFSSVVCYPRQQILGRPLEDFYSLESRQEMNSGGYQRALKDEFAIEDRQLLTSDGRIIETLLRVKPEMDSEGNITGTRAMFIDITTRKQLETAEREQRKLTEALRQAALVISSSLEFDIVLDRLLEQIATVIRYDVAQVLLVEEDQARPVRLRGHGQFEQLAPQDEADFTLDIAETGNLQEMLETGLPLIIPDTADFEAWQHVSSFSQCRSWIGTPISIQERVVAFLGLYKIEPDFYELRDIERLGAFASQTAVAIENAHLYQTTQQKVNQLTALNTISQAATSTLELEEVLNVITDRVTELLDSEAASLVLKDEAANELLFATASGEGADFIKGRRLAPNQGIVGWCIQHGEPALVTDATADPRFYDHFDRDRKYSTRSVLCMPLYARGKILGALEVINKKNGNFTRQDQQLLSLLASPAATAIENAQLYRQSRHQAAELERRVAERTVALSAANAELARAARMKDEFLASMSHELRTPLNAILGMSEALQEETFGPLNEDQLDSLHDIEESGRHLLSLINDILDLSKIEAGKLELQMEPVSIATVSQASLRLVKQNAHKKGIKLLATTDETVQTVLADERQLKQILVNLLSNAVKFTPEKGTVGLEIMGDSKQNVIYFTVWDTGIGITPEDMERLFLPFVQLDSHLGRRYGGTGLGLALVYRMVELHGGSISVDSEVGQGSRFTATLPWRAANTESLPAPLESDLAAPSAFIADAPPATTLPAGFSATKPLLLMAEDNESNIKVISRYLINAGYRVEVARNGKEALALASQTSPDLILMDIQMPEMDGLEAIRQLRAGDEFARTPIIAVTALAMTGDRERCLAAGANEYLSKPVNLKMLLETIETHLAQT